MREDVTVEEIQKALCKHFNVNLGDLKSKRRSKNITLPRHIAMYLCRKHTSDPHALIGFKFGGRDHSTVVHATKSIEKKRTQDAQILASIISLEENL